MQLLDIGVARADAIPPGGPMGSLGVGHRLGLVAKRMGSAMLDTLTPIGTELHIPETIQEDAPYFSADAPDGLADARAYYDQYGYVVLRGLIPKALCGQVRAVFDAEVRKTPIPMLRQKNMRYELNELDSDGFLSNPIFNLQDIGSGKLGGFRSTVLDVLTHRATATATSGLLGCERSMVIQSMFFEAPAGTWAHQDSYYQDSATGLGGCVAGWFALEDIDAGGGRFYVCPGSHRNAPLLRNEGEYNFATGHEAYRQGMLEMMRSHGLSFAAPFLAAGDVLFWNSLTVHGSLPASRPGVSRSSLTAHYLRDGDAMLQFHSRVRPQKTMIYNGMTVGLLHDQDELHNRLIRTIAFHMPKPYMAARRLALQALLAKRGFQSKLNFRGGAAVTP
jgi:phytanoyl-CoA hydroxylase